MFYPVAKQLSHPRKILISTTVTLPVTLVEWALSDGTRGHGVEDVRDRDSLVIHPNRIQFSKTVFGILPDMGIERLSESITSGKRLTSELIRTADPASAGGEAENEPTAVAKLEQRAVVYISSLHFYIEAVGGKLKIFATFPGAR